MADGWLIKGAWPKRLLRLDYNNNNNNNDKKM